MAHARKHIWLPVLVLAAGCSPGTPVANQDALVDRAQMDEVLPDVLPDVVDARPDRPDARTSDGGVLGDTTRPEGTHYDFCNDPIFEVPRHTEEKGNEQLNIRGMDEHGVGYDFFGLVPPFAFYLDMDTCTEYPLDQLQGPDWHYPFVTALSNGVLLLEFHKKEPDGIFAVVALQPSTWTAQVIHVDRPGQYEFMSFTNGRQVAVFTAPVSQLDQDFDSAEKTILLVDLETGDRTEVWTGPADAVVGPTDMSDDLLVFRDTGQYCHGPSSGWYLDLHTKQADPVLGLCDGEHPTWSFVSGYRVGYQRDWDIYEHKHTCGVKDVDQGWNVILTEDDHTMCFGALQQDLVFWNTDVYGTYPDADYQVGDIVAMDLVSGEKRRLTTEARHVHVIPTIALPRIVVNTFRHDIPVSLVHVVNLQALGVIDDQGNLLAGPGLDEITLLGDR